MDECVAYMVGRKCPTSGGLPTGRPMCTTMLWAVLKMDTCLIRWLMVMSVASDSDKMEAV